MERVEVLRKELGVEGKKVIGISWKSLGSMFLKKEHGFRTVWSYV